MPLTDLDVFEHLRLEKDNGILTVSLSNPERRNATTVDMISDLTYVWGKVNLDSDVKVIVLQGDPTGFEFCAGTDAQDVQKEQNKNFVDSSPRHVELCISKGETKMLLQMLACTKPILSKVKGSAFDVGASMALLADIVIAEEGAVFCDSRVSLGGTGELSVHVWTTLLGYHKAKEYLFSGKLLPAEEAMKLGVVNYCVNSNDIQSVVAEKTKLFAQLSPEAVRRTKLSVNAGLTQLLYKDLGTTPFKNTLLAESEEHFEASRAYLEKCQGNYREH